MILAISLCETDAEDLNGTLIYTSKIATFEYEHPALEFAKDKDHIMLVDLDDGKIIKDASVVIRNESDESTAIRFVNEGKVLSEFEFKAFSPGTDCPSLEIK